MNSIFSYEKSSIIHFNSFNVFVQVFIVEYHMMILMNHSKLIPDLKLCTCVVPDLKLCTCVVPDLKLCTCVVPDLKLCTNVWFLI